MRRTVNLKIVIPCVVVGLLVLFAAVGALGAGFGGTSLNARSLSRRRRRRHESFQPANTDTMAEDGRASEAGAGSAGGGVDAAIPPTEPPRPTISCATAISPSSSGAARSSPLSIASGR